MRVGLAALSAVVFAAMILAATASGAFAGCHDPDCDLTPALTTIAVRPAPLDLADARLDLYLLNPGPIYAGPNVLLFARPAYSETGYALARPYPYVRFHTGDHGRQYYQAWRYQAWRHRPHHRF